MDAPPQSYQQYASEEPKKNRPWGTIVFLVFGIIVVAVVIWMFLARPLLLVQERTNDFFNQASGGNQGIAVGEPNLSACGEDLYNCDDFNTSAEAQAVYDVCIDQNAGDIHQLDNDGDGKVCEGLS